MDRDNQATRPHLTSLAVMSFLRGGLDHLAALHDVAQEPGIRPISGYTLCRAAIENAAGALYLVSPDDRATRVLRRLHLAAADERDRNKVHDLNAQPLQRPLKDRLEDLADRGTAAGLSRDNVLGAVPSWTRIVEQADLAAGLGHRVETSWRLCSGFAHGRQWAELAAQDRGEHVPLGDGVVAVQMKASLTTLLWCVRTAVILTEQALDRARRMSMLWTGLGPDVEV